MTTTVKVTAPPGAGFGGTTYLATPMSAYGPLLISAAAESLAGLGSGSFCEVLTARLVTGPVTCSVPVSVSVTVWPMARLPIAQRPEAGA